MDATVFIDKAKKAKPQPIYVLTGDEEFLKRRRSPPLSISLSAIPIRPCRFRVMPAIKPNSLPFAMNSIRCPSSAMPGWSSSNRPIRS